VSGPPRSRSLPEGLASLSGAWGILAAALLFVLLLALIYPEAVFDRAVFVSPDSVAPLGFADYVRAKGLERALWNPFLFAGMPAYASLSYNPGLYPVSSLLRIGIDSLALPPLTWLLAHYLWAALGLFLLLRGRRVRGWLAWLAGAWFILLPAQVAIGAYGHGSKVMTLAWIPWVLLFCDRLIGRRRPLLDAGALAASLAGLLLTAHIQVVYYGLLCAGLFAGFRLVLIARRQGAQAITRPLLLGLLALVLAGGAAALLYAPVQEYSHHSIRGVSQGGGADYRFATGWSLHPAEWSTFLLPSSWGFGEATYFGRMPMTNYPNYLGALPLLAGLLLFVAGPRRRFDLFFAGLALFATLVAAGRHLPVLYRPLYELLPWFNRFRVPVMILLLQQLSVAILFARGLERAFESELAAKRLRLLVAAGALGLLLCALLGPEILRGAAVEGLSEKFSAQLARAPAAQARALVAGLASQAAGWLRAESLRAGLLLIPFLAALEGLRRRRGTLWGVMLLAAAALVVIGDLYPMDRRVLHPERHWQSLAGVRLWGGEESPSSQLPTGTLAILEDKLGTERFYALPGSRFAGNEAAARGLANLGGYHAAKLALADSVLKALPRGGVRLLSRFAVRYLVSPRPIELGAGFALAGQAEEYVYENRNARPRLFLASEIRRETAAASRQRLLAGGGESGVVYLDGEPLPAPEPGEGPPGEILRADWGLDELSFRVRMLRPGVLVLADMAYPGWRVRQDGTERPLLTADGFFRAVAVDAGEHELHFRFEPAGVGALVLLRRIASLLMALLLLAGLWRILRSRGAPDPPPAENPVLEVAS